jgi:hypothetical protein
MGKPVPKKAIFYLPIISRLSRMYMPMQTAKKMTWHSKIFERRKGLYELQQHSSNGLAWKTFD